MQMEGRTEDMKKVVAAFRKYTDAPKNGVSLLRLLNNPNMFKRNEWISNPGIYQKTAHSVQIWKFQALRNVYATEASSRSKR